MTVRRPHGFTLIEVMVALAITAIALMAGLQATGALTRNATRQSDVLLAQLCADNALAQLRLLRQLPAIGDTAQTCTQAGQAFALEIHVRPRPIRCFGASMPRCSPKATRCCASPPSRAAEWSPPA